MSNAMLFEDYLRMRASRGDLGMCIITQDDALAIADWIEKNRKEVQDKRAKWISHSNEIYCSRCGHFSRINTYSFCPNCGARMEKGD